MVPAFALKCTRLHIFKYCDVFLQSNSALSSLHYWYCCAHIFNSSLTCRHIVLSVWSPSIPHAGINQLSAMKKTWIINLLSILEEHTSAYADNLKQNEVIVLCSVRTAFLKKQWQLLTYWYFRSCNTKIVAIQRVWNLDNLHTAPSKKWKILPAELLYRFSIPAQFYCLAENIAKLMAVNGLLWCNAAVVSAVMNVYCSFNDISKQFITLDSKCHPDFSACEDDQRLWRQKHYCSTEVNTSIWGKIQDKDYRQKRFFRSKRNEQ